MERHIEVRLGRWTFDLADITVEPVVFLYMFSMFLFIPTFQSLIFDKICLQKHSQDFCTQLNKNETFIEQNKADHHGVITDTSHWILYTNLAGTIPCFVMMVLFLGPLGDKIGRKVPVLLPCIGSLINYLSWFLNAKYISAPLYLMCIGSFINGIFGSFPALFMSAYSYIGHISTGKSKVIRIAIVQSMHAFAGTLGVLVSGVILDRQGYLFVFGFLMCLAFCSILFVVVWIENVRNNEPEEENMEFCQSVSKFFKDSSKCVTKRREPKVFKSIFCVGLAFNLLIIVFAGKIYKCTYIDKFKVFQISQIWLRRNLWVKNIAWTIGSSLLNQNLYRQVQMQTLIFHKKLQKNYPFYFELNLSTKADTKSKTYFIMRTNFIDRFVILC